MTTVDELLPDCQQLHTRLRAFSTVANRKISDTDASSQIPQLQAVGQAACSLSMRLSAEVVSSLQDRCDLFPNRNRIDASTYS